MGADRTTDPAGQARWRKRTVSVREVVNGLMYVLSTGCQWRAIPKDLPPRSTVNGYFALWDYDGTLDRIHHALYVQCREQAGREASPSAAIIDSQSVKSAEKGGRISMRLRRWQEDQRQEAPYACRHPRTTASRRGPCRRHPGSRWRRSGDGHAVRHVSLPAQTLCRWRLPGATVPVGHCSRDRSTSMSRSSNAASAREAFVMLPKRWVVERTIGWLNRSRRLAKDWECLNRSALAFLRWSSVRLMLRKLCQEIINDFGQLLGKRSFGFYWRRSACLI